MIQTTFPSAFYDNSPNCETLSTKIQKSGTRFAQAVKNHDFFTFLTIFGHFLWFLGVFCIIGPIFRDFCLFFEIFRVFPDTDPFLTRRNSAVNSFLWVWNERWCHEVLSSFRCSSHADGRCGRRGRPIPPARRASTRRGTSPSTTPRSSPARRTTLRTYGKRTR